MTFKCIPRSVAAAALLGTALFISPLLAAAQAAPEFSSDVDAERAVTAELNELHTVMGQLKHDADQLNSLVLSRLHWQTHASQLGQIRDHVNRIGDRLETLHGMRSTAAAWQQAAIDDIVPIAVEVADRTNAAISHLKENRQQLWAPEYADNLRTIAARSHQMDGLLDTHLKIIEARDKLETLQEKLADRTS